MNLLVVNFEMDPSSPVLAWQVKVACELARHCEKVVVLTHRAVPFDAPANLETFVFPRALLRAPLRWVGGAWLTNAVLWRLCRRHAVDCCFIHMNMQWAYRLFPTFRLLGIPSLMWYAHGTVSWRLRLAHRCADRVVTSSPEGFRIGSDKVAVVGQGIDTALFDVRPVAGSQNNIITVGRVSPRKRLELVVEVMAELRAKTSTRFHLKIIGPTRGAVDEGYASRLQALATSRGVADRVTFVGPLPIEEIPRHYATAFLHLNVSLTGSMDKTVVEALASGCPVLTSNEAFRRMLCRHPQYIIDDDRPEAIAERVLAIYSARAGLDRAALRRLVVGTHDVESYAVRIVEQLRGLRSAG